MANLKDLRARIKSVKSTKKITSAMKMIAAAKLIKAQEAAESSRPYAREMMRVLSNLAKNQNEFENLSSLLTGTGQDQKHLIVVVSSNRGLCGGFNTNVMRKARALKAQLDVQGKDVAFAAVGRKAYELLKSQGNKIVAQYQMVTVPKFLNADAIAEDILKRYEQGEFDACHVVYNKFESALAQVPTTERLIPVEITAAESDAVDETSGSTYEYEPSQEVVYNTLLTRNIRVQIFKYLLESVASEHGARMAAMDGATRNASEMINDLNLTYNRTRQAVITNELIEIISGAEAL